MPVADGFASYDPLAVRDDQPGPSGLVDADGNPLPSFDPKHTEAFSGLLYLGALSSTFDFFGHRFVIRTLTVKELLVVASVTRDFQGTIGEGKAYTAAMVAMAVQSVDGEPLPSPIGETPGSPHAWARRRFDYVTENWFAWTIDHVYERYLELEQVVKDVLEAMGKASGPTESQANSNATSAGPNDRDS
jgi:hypothetical protein